MPPKASTAQHRCTFCARKFVRAEHLIRHERTHTKEKPFACQLCELRFARIDLLRRHERKSHVQSPAHAGKSPTGKEYTVSISSQQSLPQTTNTPTRQPTDTSSYLIMPLSQTPNTDQASYGTAPSSLQDPENSNFWISGNLPSPSYDMASYLQACFSQEDLNWSESMSFSPSGSNEIRFNETVDISKPDSFMAVDDMHTQNVAPTQQGQSILSRPGSPPLACAHDRFTTPAKQVAKQRAHTVTEEHRTKMQAEINAFTSLALPSRNTLSRFIQSYFRSFHRHQPFLHEQTWSPDESATPLVLAMCANGALYSLERNTAVRLYKAAILMLGDHEQGLWVLQTMMLIIAFAAWNGHDEDIRLALRFQARLIFVLRKEWTIFKLQSASSSEGWLTWIKIESMRRTTYCLFTVLNLLALAYDVPSSLSLEDEHGLPCNEALWVAENEEQWSMLKTTIVSQGCSSVENVIERLGSTSQPKVTNLGMFGCHVVISTILQKIMLFRRACFGDTFGGADIRQKYLQVLRRWQIMWEAEPEASLSPDHPCGPILFNCTAILRVAYVRLVADYAPVRAGFMLNDFSDQIVQRMISMKALQRGPLITRAAQQACLALRVPVNLGFEVVARTSFWIWSVQHALCYFECALLLSQWLQAIEGAENMTKEEQAVQSMIEEVIHAAEDGGDPDTSLPISVLLTWARLLDTGGVTVWRIMPRMAQELRSYAYLLSENNRYRREI